MKENKIVIICEPHFQKELLSNIRQSNFFMDIKFYSKQQLETGIYGDFDDELLKDLIKSFPHLTLTYLNSLIPALLRAIYYKKDIPLLSPFIDLAKKHFVRDQYFLLGFKDCLVQVYGYDLELDFELRNLVSLLHAAKVTVSKKDINTESKKEIISFPRIQDEMIYVFNRIIELKKKGTSFNDIGLIVPRRFQDTVEFKRMSDNYNFLFNGSAAPTLDELPIFNDFIKSGDYLRDSDEIVDLHFMKSYQDYPLEHQTLLVQLIAKHNLRKYDSNSSDETVRNYYLFQASKMSLSRKVYEEAITIYDETSVNINKNHVFITSFNHPFYPSFRKSTLLLKDEELITLNMLPNHVKNRITRDNLIAFLKRDKIEINISLHEFEETKKVYQSTLVNDLSFEVKKFNNVYIWRSEKEAIYQYDFEVETFAKYGIILPQVKYFIEHKIETNYGGFSPKFLKYKHENETRPISYTQLNTFNECPFRYYITYILKLESLEEYDPDSRITLNVRQNPISIFKQEPLVLEDFNLRLGTFLHNTIEEYFTQKSPVSIDHCMNAYDMAVQEKMFTPTELVLVKNLSKELAVVIDFNEQFYHSHPLWTPTFEKQISSAFSNQNDGSVEIYGRIDSLLFNDRTMEVMIIDFKSGSETTARDLYHLGLKLQLPFYASLLKHSLDFKKYYPIGIFTQRVTFDKSLMFLAQEKQKSILLDGLFIRSADKLFEIDPSLSGGATSRYFKGISVNKDNNISGNSKHRFFDPSEMNEYTSYVEKYASYLIQALKDNYFEVAPLRVYNAIVPGHSAEKIKKGTISDACKYCSCRDLCYKNDSCYRESFVERKQNHSIDEDDDFGEGDNEE